MTAKAKVKPKDKPKAKPEVKPPVKPEVKPKVDEKVRVEPVFELKKGKIPPVPRPKNIKVQVACVPNMEKEVATLFYSILDDYSRRFNVPVTKEVWHISICLVEYQENNVAQGMAITNFDENKILIQLRDPMLNQWQPNLYTLIMFIAILCHEIVHACQELTGRNGFSVRGAKVDKKDEMEEYFFDPFEVEARVLQDFYTSKFGGPLL